MASAAAASAAATGTTPPTPDPILTPAPGPLAPQNPAEHREASSAGRLENRYVESLPPPPPPHVEPYDRPATKVPGFVSASSSTTEGPSESEGLLQQPAAPATFGEAPVASGAPDAPASLVATAAAAAPAPALESGVGAKRKGGLRASGQTSWRSASILFPRAAPRPPRGINREQPARAVAVAAVPASVSASTAPAYAPPGSSTPSYPAPSNVSISGTPGGAAAEAVAAAAAAADPATLPPLPVLGPPQQQQVLPSSRDSSAANGVEVPTETTDIAAATADRARNRARGRNAEKKRTALRNWRSASHDHALVLVGAARLPRKVLAKTMKMPGACWVDRHELGQLCSLPLEVKPALAKSLAAQLPPCASCDDNEEGRGESEGGVSSLFCFWWWWWCFWWRCWCRRRCFLCCSCCRSWYCCASCALFEGRE